MSSYKAPGSYSVDFFSNKSNLVVANIATVTSNALAGIDLEKQHDESMRRSKPWLWLPYAAIVLVSTVLLITSFIRFQMRRIRLIRDQHTRWRLKNQIDYFRSVAPVSNRGDSIKAEMRGGSCDAGAYGGRSVGSVCGKAAPMFRSLTLESNASSLRSAADPESVAVTGKVGVGRRWLKYTSSMKDSRRGGREMMKQNVQHQQARVKIPPMMAMFTRNSSANRGGTTVIRQLTVYAAEPPSSDLHFF